MDAKQVNESEPAKFDDSIGGYYERKRLAAEAVRREIEAARAAGASSREIQRLEEKCLWAGYTGD